jgi:hypothetical protein
MAGDVMSSSRLLFKTKFFGDPTVIMRCDIAFGELEPVHWAPAQLKVWPTGFHCDPSAIEGTKIRQNNLSSCPHIHGCSTSSAGCEVAMLMLSTGRPASLLSDPNSPHGFPDSMSKPM